MARVSGKCPSCGQIIHVNDERERGHCGKCGAEISTQEAILLFQKGQSASSGAASHFDPSQSDPLRQQRRAERARERAEREQQQAKDRAEQERQQSRERAEKEQNDAASRIIQDMFQLCASEQDYMALRARILQMDRPDGEKARLLACLDSATSQRLKDTLEKAKDYEESQGPSSDSIWGFVIISSIGLLINYFFHMKIPGIIAVVLAGLGVFSDYQKRHDPKIIAKNKAAAELIEQYRNLGYKI